MFEPTCRTSEGGATIWSFDIRTWALQYCLASKHQDWHLCTWNDWRCQCLSNYWNMIGKSLDIKRLRTLIGMRRIAKHRFEALLGFQIFTHLKSLFDRIWLEIKWTSNWHTTRLFKEGCSWRGMMPGETCRKSSGRLDLGCWKDAYILPLRVSHLTTLPRQTKWTSLKRCETWHMRIKNAYYQIKPSHFEDLPKVLTCDMYYQWIIKSKRQVLPFVPKIVGEISTWDIQGLKTCPFD